MRFFVAGAAFLAALVAGTHTDDHVSDGSTTNSCDDGVFCNGISLPTTSGGCTPLDDPCDDLDDTTVDTCDEEYRRCYHVVASGDDAVCRVDCVSDCEGKDCGEDGCGSFCGTCETGEGCSGVGLCAVGTLEGTCNAPLNLGGGDSPYVLALPDDGDRITVVTEGDTSNAVHLLVPSCNYLTAAPELVYAFEVPEELVADGASVGFDIRVHGYDTVLEVMFGTCAIDNSIGCADDSVPPGEFGSRVAGMITTAGSYYVMVDGFSSSEKGEFELTATFVRNCEPECDGNFCGADLCGAQCGSCGDGETCNLEDTRCYPSDCEPQCAGVNRVCGADGCGGTCGTCGGDEYCLGESISVEEEGDPLPDSSCVSFYDCDHDSPVCDPGCGGDEFCGTDCQCYNTTRGLPDMIVLEEELLDSVHLHDVFVPETSCTLVEGCVLAPGMRRLLRFSVAALNQGTGDFAPPEPKTRPDLFEFGQCHNHYHYRSFAQYRLYDADGETLYVEGRKYAFCMEDTARFHDGADVSCNHKFDCGAQGIQKGWLDVYGWSLDCSWIDITDTPPGDYVIQVRVNPDKVFMESSFDNNRVRIAVTIPDAEEGTIAEPLKLTTSVMQQEDDLDGAGAAMPAVACLVGAALMM